jgi:hypothetical protein
LWGRNQIIMSEAYITRIAKFLPNESVSNEEMEEYLGYINGKPSKSKAIVLRNNGIKRRYYALLKDGTPTHSNAEMAALAVSDLFKNNSEEIAQVDLLSCATSSPDQLMPSHGSMVHGYLPGSGPIEVVSPSGVCCAGMHAFKYAYMSVKLGEKQRQSPALPKGSRRSCVPIDLRMRCNNCSDWNKIPTYPLKRTFSGGCYRTVPGLFWLNPAECRRNFLENRLD